MRSRAVAVRLLQKTAFAPSREDIANEAKLSPYVYFTAVILIQLGIFSTRWNVVIGGQLFSKSFRGLMTYKMEVMGIEGLLAALLLLALPFIILAVLIRLLPGKRLDEEAPSAGQPLGPLAGTDAAALGT